MGVAIQCEDAVGCRVVKDHVRIFGRRDSAEHVEGFAIEHDHGLVVTGGGESMACGLRHRSFVRTLDTGNFAEQRPAVFIDDHHAILPGNKQTVIGGSGTM